MGGGGNPPDFWGQVLAGYGYRLTLALLVVGFAIAFVVVF